MEWIKVNKLIVKHPIMQALIDQYGYVALGVYMSVLLMFDDKIPYIRKDELNILVCRKTKYAMIKDVVLGRGLFVEKDGKIYIALNLADPKSLAYDLQSCTDACPITAESECLDECPSECPDPCEPIKEKIREECKENKKTAIPSRLKELIDRLGSDECQMFRESMMMHLKMCYRRYFEEDFAWCMHFILTDAIATGIEIEVMHLTMVQRQIRQFVCRDNKMNELITAFNQRAMTDQERLFFDELKEKFPHIMSLPSPLTEQQLLDLYARFGKQHVWDTMFQLENFADIFRYHSAFDALMSWGKRK